MKIAVVILNWNGRKLLEQFLPSVIEFSDEADLYVADNASDDDSVAFIEQSFPSVKIIQNHSNLGFARGYNTALTDVDADIYALVNSDIEVTASWLQPIVETFERDPGITIIQPKIRDYKNKEYFEYAGAAGGFIDKFGYPFCRGRIFETIEKDYGQYDDECDIFWASGACFFIRSDAYKKLNGFDDTFFAHQEEIDLCWRAFNDKQKIRYIPQSLVYHVGGATLDAGNPTKTYLNFRNSLLMLLKNLPKSKLAFVILIRLILDGIAAIRFLSQGRSSHFLAIIKAHLTFYSMIPPMYKKRKGLNFINYYKRRSIVYDYYVSKKRTFKELFNNSLSLVLKL